MRVSVSYSSKEARFRYAECANRMPIEYLSKFFLGVCRDSLNVRLVEYLFLQLNDSDLLQKFIAILNVLRSYTLS
jgi:hypothetical protein